jgi:hypothetical protein
MPNTSGKGCPPPTAGGGPSDVDAGGCGWERAGAVVSATIAQRSSCSQPSRIEERRFRRWSMKRQPTAAGRVRGEAEL